MSVVVTFDAQPNGRDSTFGRKIRRGTVALGAYATNGVAVTKSTFELAVSLDGLTLSASAGYVPEWDKANGKVKVYWQTDPAAVGGANVPLVEVTDATDLSAVALRFRAEGK